MPQTPFDLPNADQTWSDGWCLLAQTLQAYPRSHRLLIATPHEMHTPGLCHTYCIAFYALKKG